LFNQATKKKENGVWGGGGSRKSMIKNKKNKDVAETPGKAEQVGTKEKTGRLLGFVYSEKTLPKKKMVSKKEAEEWG